MTSTALRDGSSLTRRHDVQKSLEAVLDGIPLTERPYHLLNFSMPLVTEILARTQAAAEPGDRVLLIGGNLLLGESLVKIGYALDIWAFPGQSLSEDLESHVTATVTQESLAAGDLQGEGYRVIIVPLVLESLDVNAEKFFWRLRQRLSSQGTVIVATANQTRLETRISAIGGKSFGFRRKAPRLSLNWAALPTVHHYHRDELVSAGTAAGYEVRSCDFVKANRLFLELDVLPAEQYVIRKAGDYLTQLMPSLRDTIVLEMRSRMEVGDRWDLSEPKFVSVFVAAVNGRDRLRQTLASLLEQTYPHDLFEIVVIHKGQAEIRKVLHEHDDAKVEIREFISDQIEGPSVRNRVMAQSGGDISAHTDDSCRLPVDWIEAAVVRFDRDTAVVSGPVFAVEDSDPRFLQVPGLRPEPADDEIWRSDLFPVCNVFYRTAVTVAAGGYSREFETDDGDAAAGWDTELAWRLQHLGWQVRFREEAFVFRSFPPPPGRRVITEHKKATEIPRMYARIPELRGQLLGGVFASRSTMYFDLMLAGTALAISRRRWPWLLAALPWLGLISKRLDVWPPTQWRHSARMGARLGALHLSWFTGFLRGAIKAKRIVL